MAKNDDKDSLLGLFSTRRNDSDRGSMLPSKSEGGIPVTSTRPVTRRNFTSENSVVNNSNSGSFLPSSESSSTPWDTQNGAKQDHSYQSNSTNKVGGLSPLANTILREARHELGTDAQLRGDSERQKNIKEETIVKAVDRVLQRRREKLDDIERANIIIHLQKDLLGWGVLQPLIDNRDVTDIHVYDYQTVVLQRGKKSELTGIHWPNHQAYTAFIDRLLMRVGKSLSTQQHTVDCSYSNGIRICAVHESVCGSCGPLLSIRIPRIATATLDGIVSYQTAPQLIVDYLGCITRSGLATMMLSGETGTGKTTLMRALATQFGPDESIVAVEDTPELNLQHPFFRSLVSRTANLEGVGEVTLQEHIKTTLRMTPTRVLLGEMRTPPSAEAFLEAAQTGHVGMSTIHARNARETLVRLEGLLGRAQQSVSIDIIRQQIALAVDVVVWLIREKESGKPRVGEIIEVGHFVEGVIQVRPMFTLIKTGKNPIWRLDS